MAVEKMQFSMPMAASFTATLAEKQEAPIVNAKLKKEEMITKAKAEVEKQAEQEAAIINAKAEVEKRAALRKPTPEEAAFIAMAARRGPGMALPDDVDCSPEVDLDYDSDESPEVNYSRLCERADRRTRELFARMPWIEFEPDSSILEMQEEYEREQEELKKQMEVVWDQEYNP